MTEIFFSIMIMVAGAWMPLAEYFGGNPYYDPFKFDTMQECKAHAEIMMADKPDFIKEEIKILCDVKEDGVSTFTWEKRELE